MAPSQPNATTPGGSGMPGRAPGMEDAPEPDDGTMPGRLPGTPRGPGLAPEQDDDADALARLRARRSVADLTAAEAAYAAGRIPYDEILRARLAKAVAEADVAGDAEGAARAKLQYAEEILRLTEGKFRAGLVTAGEVDKARFEQDEAQHMLSQQQQAGERTRPAEDKSE